MNTNKQTKSEINSEQEEQSSKKPTTSLKEANNKWAKEVKERQMKARIYEAEYHKKLQNNK